MLGELQGSGTGMAAVVVVAVAPSMSAKIVVGRIL